MAKKNDTGISILTASALGRLEKDGFSRDDLQTANAEIQKLAANPTPDNRYEIGQILALSVDNVMNVTEDWLAKVADVKNVAFGEKAQFRVDTDSIKAYVQAKGGTTPRTKVFSKYVTVDTEEVSARPYINLNELRSGKVDFTDIITQAAKKMTIEKLKKVDAVLRGAATGWGVGAYGSGAGIVKNTFDPILQNMQRLGKASIVGDIYAISKLNGISGFNGTSAPSDKLQDEIMENGYIGKYIGADVFKINNPVISSDFDVAIDKKWIYILAGMVSPLKLVNEGGVTSVDSTNIDDNSYETCLRQNFGAAVVLGNIPTIGAYQDTTV